MSQPTAIPTVTAKDLGDWLSQPRLSKYVIAAGGNLQTALRLYMWNSAVAAAALADTGHLEVALRNAYDRAVSVAHPDWGVDPSGTLFEREQGHPQARSKQFTLNQGSKQAISATSRTLGSTPTHGKVVAGLSFGFWVKFTERERESTFWTPYLYTVFPGGISRGQVHDRVARVARFRNRLAHNEPVFSTRTGLHARLAEARDLLSEVAPAISPLVDAASRVNKVVAACPVPGLI